MHSFTHPFITSNPFIQLFIHTIVTRGLQNTIFDPAWTASVMRQWILCTSPNKHVIAGPVQTQTSSVLGSTFVGIYFKITNASAKFTKVYGNNHDVHKLKMAMTKWPKLDTGSKIRWRHETKGTVEHRFQHQTINKPYHANFTYREHPR